MEYRKLGNSGALVSRFALGSMYFAGETCEQDAFSIMDAYVEAGGNLIDTANVYTGGNPKRLSGVGLQADPKK